MQLYCAHINVRAVGAEIGVGRRGTGIAFEPCLVHTSARARLGLCSPRFAVRRCVCARLPLLLLPRDADSDRRAGEAALRVRGTQGIRRTHEWRDISRDDGRRRGLHESAAPASGQSTHAHTCAGRERRSRVHWRCRREAPLSATPPLAACTTSQCARMRWNAAIMYACACSVCAAAMRASMPFADEYRCVHLCALVCASPPARRLCTAAATRCCACQTLSGRDGAISKLDFVYIRGSKIRLMILPDMLKNAPMFKRFDQKNKVSKTQAGLGFGFGGIQSAVGGGGRGRGAPGGRGRGRGN
jgi:hypothetical protein